MGSQLATTTPEEITATLPEGVTTAIPEGVTPAKPEGATSVNAFSTGARTTRGVEANGHQQHVGGAEELRVEPSAEEDEARGRI